MPTADPQAAREIAVKHLFRHLADEQQLLRNPLVGPELLGGQFTVAQLRARVARAALAIRDEDASSGHAQRGIRQSACLMRCDLGSETVAGLAADFTISSRQLARERHAAWMRSLPHILAKTAHLAPASVNDVVVNRALALFRSRRERDAVLVLREHVVRATPVAALFVLCNLALMQHDFKRAREARATYAELRKNVASGDFGSHTRLELALCLLDVLVGATSATLAWSTRIRDLARRAGLETPRAPWMSLTLLRLLFSLSQQFVCANDYRNLLAICFAIDELAPSYEELDCHDLLALHGLRSISECKQNGFTAEMEAHMLRVLHLAVANGWTSVVAEAASLLSSVYYLSGGIPTARDYRDMALSAVSLTDDRGSIALTYGNLATAALDSGCVAAAARFSELSLAGQCDERPLLEHIPLVSAEILIGQGNAKVGTAKARDVLGGAIGSGNTRLVAIAGRVVALGLDAVGERRAAVGTLNQSLEIAAAGGCSKYDVQRIDRSFQRLTRSKPLPKRKEATFHQFCS